MGGATYDAPGEANAAPEQTALLAKALRVGVVLDFLPLSDVVLLLTSCSAALRNDVELAHAALLESSPAARHGCHLLQECWNDWFELVPKRIVGDEALMTVCCDTTHYEDDDPGRYMRIKDPVRDNYYKNKTTKACYPKDYFAQLLSVIGAFDRFILPACVDKQLFLSSYGDYTATIPMAISLWDYFQPPEQQQNDSNGSVVWTRDVVRAALNAVHAGFGDRFLDADRENAYVSQFGAHWDSIRVAKACDSDAYEASCELCEMRKTAVEGYEAQVHKQQEACNAAIAELVHKEGKPQEVGNQDELDRKIDAIERQFFPEANGDDDDPYLQEDVEDILEHVINSERVQFPPFPAGKGLTPENLFGCLQDIYGYPMQCRSVSQPLKRFFTTHCKFANRIKYDWIPRQAFATSHAYRCTKVELVGGVTSSGFFCGAFVVILQTL